MRIIMTEGVRMGKRKGRREKAGTFDLSTSEVGEDELLLVEERANSKGP